MYDLIEVTPKINKKKIAIVLVIVLLVILLFVILGINTAKKSKQNNKVDTNVVQNEIEKISKIKHIPQININSEYTDVGKVLMQNIYLSNVKTVYLTFDDGPSKSVTPLILDLLKKENIKATFFVLGSRAEKNPEVLKREYIEGHFIANHGYSHVYGNIYSSPEAVLDEYNRTRDVIQKALGIQYDGHLFRFPGGSTGKNKYINIKNDAKQLLENNNIAYIDWNALNSDAAGATTKEDLIQNAIDTIGDKTVVVLLMHDAGDKILTYEALPDIISYLRQQGYNFKNFYSIIK